jgi:hypothetical protein
MGTSRWLGQWWVPVLVLAAVAQVGGMVIVMVSVGGVLEWVQNTVLLRLIVQSYVMRHCELNNFASCHM